MADAFVHAARVQTGWTAAREKQLLVWTARRLPKWLHADHLTALAALAMLAAAGCYLLARAWPPSLLLVNVCLLVNWFGDSLDGTLARVRNQQRPRYGFYVDHVLDCAGIAVLLAGMAGSGLMSATVALAFLAAYFLVSIEVFLATYCLATFRMAVAGFGPTELRLLLAVGNVAALWHPRIAPFGLDTTLFDVGGAIAAAVLVPIFVLAAVRNGTRLFIEEPRPEAEPEGASRPPLSRSADYADSRD